MNTLLTLLDALRDELLFLLLAYDYSWSRYVHRLLLFCCMLWVLLLALHDECQN
jgi:hypothetical protein